jgi:hypothetical protein
VIVTIVDALDVFKIVAVHLALRPHLYQLRG